MRNVASPSLKWLALVLALTAAHLPLRASAGDSRAPDPRPNLLLCVADDWSWPHAGAYGDPVVRTPAFDRVAREGVLFTHAFSAAPSCTPSRAPARRPARRS